MQATGLFLHRPTVLLALLAMGGCNGGPSASRTAARPSRSPGDAASRWLPNVPLDAVRPVAADVFRSGYRLDRDRSTGEMLVSQSAEVSGQQRVERVRDVFGRPSRHRRIATLRLSQDGPAVLLQCQVRVERLDTLEQAAFATEQGDDRPNRTPIERLGADTPRPRQEWVYVNRDRQAESDILDAIARRFTATQPGEQ